MENRRKFKRLPMRGFLSCSAVFDAADATHRVPVISLSAGGMYIALNESITLPLLKGDALGKIRFDLGELQEITLTGHVAHRMSLGEIGGCGVEFDHHDEPIIEQLDGFVHRKLEEFGLLEN